MPGPQPAARRWRRPLWRPCTGRGPSRGRHPGSGPVGRWRRRRRASHGATTRVDRGGARASAWPPTGTSRSKVAPTATSATGMGATAVSSAEPGGVRLRLSARRRRPPTAGGTGRPAGCRSGRGGELDRRLDQRRHHPLPDRRLQLGRLEAHGLSQQVGHLGRADAAQRSRPHHDDIPAGNHN